LFPKDYLSLCIRRPVNLQVSLFFLLDLSYILYNNFPYRYHQAKYSLM
jgi:hypothetical protein